MLDARFRLADFINSNEYCTFSRAGERQRGLKPAAQSAPVKDVILIRVTALPIAIDAV